MVLRLFEPREPQPPGRGGTEGSSPEMVPGPIRPTPLSTAGASRRSAAYSNLTQPRPSLREGDGVRSGRRGGASSSRTSPCKTTPDRRSLAAFRRVYKSDPPLNPLLGGDLVRLRRKSAVQQPCGSQSRAGRRAARAAEPRGPQPPGAEARKDHYPRWFRVLSDQPLSRPPEPRGVPPSSQV